MKIVVLDGYALNPGDLSWSAMESLGDLTVYERSAPNEVPERAKGADALLLNKTPLPNETIEALPELRYIGVLATGYNVVDVRAARERGIVVTNIPTYGTHSVAQMAFALLLHLTNQVALHGESVRAGEWSRNPDWTYWKTPLLELDGLTMGIVGYGRIGQATGDIARAMGMRVVAFEPDRESGSETSHSASGSSRGEGVAGGEKVAFVDLDTLFSTSDVVSLHCPLTPENKGLVNAERLSQMKPTSFLINTSRGPLIDESALAKALEDGEIAGAGLDVLSQEPPPADHPLLQARNVVITPHIAWASRAARSRLMDLAVANLQAWTEGRALNVVEG